MGKCPRRLLERPLLVRELKIHGMKYGGSTPRGNGSGDHQVPSAATKSCADKRHC
jgi:hypothetical protein